MWTGCNTIAATTILACCADLATAAFIRFQNCLDVNIVNSSPRLLQFVPLNATATFNTSSTDYPLNITIYGNVTGESTLQDYPPPSDPSWSNPNSTFGKIVDLSVTNNKYTTLFSRLNVLSYTPYNAAPSRFCNSTINEQCPLGPAFYSNASDLTNLPAFSLLHDMYSSYAFASITGTFRIQSGDVSGQYYACVTATVTPELTTYLRDLLRYLPMAVLITVGVATIAAAMLSPWSTTDIFHWSSNFGRDEDVLRLVTPGFGDCLQYLQFIVLTGSLSLNYPGFYQPVVSRVSWSTLMFNESFASGGPGMSAVVDGIYQLPQASTYGLTWMGQLVGMNSPRDIWVGMIVWLVVIVVAVVILTQMGFALRWAYRQIARVPAEDLRSKNGPFTAGNVVRVVFNYFLLPLITLSFFQLIIATTGPTYAVALAAIVLVAILLFSARVIMLFLRTRPRSVLFDDLLRVLAYGPLYNTYCDDAAIFALMPIFVNFLRGIAIGGIQASGVAQLVILAISEIVLILTINAVRPYPSATSMNVYHACFSVIRLITILLSIAFVPSLGVADDARGWLGYAILLVHACVLVFGFFLNAVQTLVEVIARLAGAGNGGAARGGLTKVLGMRQLSRRMPRRDQTSRQSMASGAAMLQAMQDEPKSLGMDRSRTHSMSASSTMLLESNNRAQMSPTLGPQSPGQSSLDGTTLMSRSALQRMSSGSINGIIGVPKPRDAQDPYYRPPRRNTNEPSAPANRPHLLARDSRKNGTMTSEAVMDDEDAGEGASTMARLNQDEEEGAVELTQSKTDYAVREVDFYYGVRGPALSSGTRKLKTGPADPTAPTFSTSGWLKNLVPWKAKEKTKGFEVVRSARAPPPGLFPPSRAFDLDTAEPYHDDPHTRDEARKELFQSRIEPDRPSHRNDVGSVAIESDDDDSDSDRLPVQAPSLPRITSVGAIELPSRIGSEASKKSKRKPPQGLVPDVPPIPRKSSRRDSSRNSREILDMAKGVNPYQAAPTSPYPPTSFPTGGPRSGNLTPTSSSSRLPFQSNNTGRASRSNRYSAGAESTTSSVMQNMREISDGDDDENVLRNSGSAQQYATHLRNSSLNAATINDRPSSMGFVQQHRASDNIRYNPATPEFEGSRAEIYNRGEAKK